jgi:predicted PurR-regulated permease PerM
MNENIDNQEDSRTRESSRDHLPSGETGKGPEHIAPWLYVGKRAAQAFVVTVALVGFIILLFTTFRSLTLTVLTALLLAYLLEPIVDMVEAHGVVRWRATAIVFVLLGLILTLGLLLVVPMAAGQIIYFSQQAPEYVKKLVDYFYELFRRVDSSMTYDWPSFADLLRSKVQDNIPEVANRLTQIFSLALQSTVSVISTFLLIALVPIVSFYLLLSSREIKGSAIELIPPHFRTGMVDKINKFDHVLSGFIRGQVVVSLILAVLYSIGFVLIGIDLAIPVGVTGGLLFFIPYLGTLIAGIFATLLAIVKFWDIWHPIYVIAWISLVQFFEGYFITPKIVGDAVGLHPALYIMAIIAGGQLMGLLGILVAVPIAAMLKVLTQTGLEYYRETAFYQGPETK